jgi:hypothetical protein
MRSLQQIVEIVNSNIAAKHADWENNWNKSNYEGLLSCEIGKYNGALMHGDQDQAFPSPEEWSMITD